MHALLRTDMIPQRKKELERKRKSYPAPFPNFLKDIRRGVMVLSFKGVLLLPFHCGSHDKSSSKVALIGLPCPELDFLAQTKID
eukprot:1160620-Pelagomonas_calceolata.AAC.1